VTIRAVPSAQPGVDDGAEHRLQQFHEVVGVAFVECASATRRMSSTGTPDWSLPGTTGSVAVTGSTDTTAPHVNVDAPFSVTETQVHTLQAGEGPVVADTAISVNLCEVPVLSPPATVRGLRHLHRCSGSLVGQHPRGRHDWCLMDPRFPPEPIADLSLLSSARMCVATC
jgi:hypothetical protein